MKLRFRQKVSRLLLAYVVCQVISVIPVSALDALNKQQYDDLNKATGSITDMYFVHTVLVIHM